MKLLDLFSGIAGFSKGLEKSGFETIAFCEIEDYPRKVLAKNWPNVPIARDITKLTYKNGVLYDDGKEIYRGSIDAICGGFPCQDISAAGNQEGIKEGTRSGLWSECARLLREIRPSYAIFENVTALLSGEQGRWFQRVLFDISEVGYDAEWHCIPATHLGAWHERDRVWIIAYPESERIQGFGASGEQKPYTHEKPILSVRNCEGRKLPNWETEPELDRVVDGVPDRAHRIKALGNAVLPQIPELIGHAIKGYIND